MEFFNEEERYVKIINFICSYKNIQYDEMIKILKDKECKYLLFLLLKKFDCTDRDTLSKYLYSNSKKSLNYNFKKAQEKFFLNKEFREKYFEVEYILKEIL